MTEIEFLQQEEERFSSYLEMHENSAKKLREEINMIHKIKELLQGGQPGDTGCPEGQICDK